MTRYVVVENTPGYLPESEPYETNDYDDAERQAEHLVDEITDWYIDSCPDIPGLFAVTRIDNEWKVLFNDPTVAKRIVEIQSYDEEDDLNPHGYNEVGDY